MAGRRDRGAGGSRGRIVPRAGAARVTARFTGVSYARGRIVERRMAPESCSDSPRSEMPPESPAVGIASPHTATRIPSSRSTPPACGWMRPHRPGPLHIRRRCSGRPDAVSLPAALLTRQSSSTSTAPPSLPPFRRAAALSVVTLAELAASPQSPKIFRSEPAATAPSASRGRLRPCSFDAAAARSVPGKDLVNQARSAGGAPTISAAQTADLTATFSGGSSWAFTARRQPGRP